MSEEDDDVIQEIPVYVSQTLAKQLFIYQYPTRPAFSTYPENPIVKSSIKPQLQEVELELGIDTRSVNYDSGRGEQIAINADGVSSSSKSGDEPVFPSGKMDHMTLKSSRLLPDSSNYAIGVLNDGELHLTPLKGIVSLRPTFSYLDKSDKRPQNSQDELSGGEEEEELKQVKVKFARQENERLKKAREQSYDYHSKISSSEPWYHTQYVSENSDEAELERCKLYCAQISEKVADLNLNDKDYLEYLIDPDAVDESTSGASKRCLKAMNLADQVRSIMKEARLLSFRHLMTLLPGPVDVQLVLKSIQNVALLVRGNWIVRSDILYPKETFSAVSGVPSEVMIRCRDYVLLQFTQHKYVDRIAVNKIVKLPTAELLEILDGIATLKKNKGWELKLPLDKDFIERYSEIVHRMESFWEARQRSLNEAFRHKPQTPPTSPTKLRGSRSGSRRRDSSFSSDGEGPSRQRKKSLSVPGISSEVECFANGTNDQAIAQKKSTSASVDSDSGTEGRHVNSSSELTPKPSKRTRKSLSDDTEMS
ncbi:DNA-directed RNA polymerase III subunit RPC5 [Frankliniella fusca]|uniref:DNA-directed RNA polymerase III subunit RPC5 n=1 Tax=Frankliniella fusca TaxID=407009 RepID=A0AAE1I168_9NEOP|nr:DNA-directed RNA polymerase III subunit RPC5 [Frankliniella fusca]